MIEFTTVDAHVGGAPVRLITGGVAAPRGRSMREKTAWMSRHADHVRRALMREPRGHGDMTGALLTEAVHPGSHAGLVFLTADGYPPLAGHAVIGATAIALSRGLVNPGGDGRSVVYDTAAGAVRARAVAGEDPAVVSRVAYIGVPSFVLVGGLAVKLATRTVRVDVAFGGAFYAIVDAESLGLSVEASQLPFLRSMGQEVSEAVDGQVNVAHPSLSGFDSLAGTLFTAPPRSPDAHLRNVTVLADGTTGRSASGTGMCAVMAVLDAMGLLAEDGPFVMEGVAGTQFVGRVHARTRLGDQTALVPEIEGSAWVTGEHRFIVDPADPFATGWPA